MMKSKIWKKKKFTGVKILSTLVLIMFLPIELGHASTNMTSIPEEFRVKPVIVEAPKVSDWDLFTEALIWQESRGNECVVGDSGKAVGVLQIWPIMVDEANRIQKDVHFTYDDRMSREQSIAIFNVIQSHYNSGKDYKKALKIWNPGHPLSYETNIMSKFEELKKEKRGA